MTQDTSDVPQNPKEMLQDTENHSLPSESSPQPTGGDGTQTSDEILQLRSEIAQLREQIARAQADYSNFVRRSRDEQSQIGEWSENKTILKFLPVLDNLERALEHIPNEFQGHAWTE